MVDHFPMGSKSRFRRRLPITMMVLYCFGATAWIRDAVSFHLPPHRRVDSFVLVNDLCRVMRLPSDAEIKSHPRRKHCVAAASVTSETEREREITVTTKASNAANVFDYRRVPPISDTTPCEVIPTFTRDYNDLDSGTSKCHEEKEFYFPSPEELNTLPKGDRGGYHIVRQYTMVGDSFVDASWNENGITAANITLQHALTVLDPDNYPTLTRARKACRKGMVLVHRNHHNTLHSGHNDNGNSPSDTGAGTGFQRGNVGDHVSPRDVIGVQMFLGTYRKKQCYPNIEYSRPQFQLPVLYEDDHLAVVHKPAGVAVYSDTRNGNGNQGSNSKTGNRRTVHFALPFVLTPPRKGTRGGILRRPGIVHRIDKPTSGVLLVAKTKAASESLYEQFRNRDVHKIYTAVINGDLLQEQQDQVGYPQYQQPEVEPKWQKSNEESNYKKNNNDDDIQYPEHAALYDGWNRIDYPLGGKHALTSWKILRRARSLNARDGILTMVQIRLHTGRYHQIRRHFAWWCRKPLVGDHLYAGLLQAHHFRKKGLFLCSNGISFLHPMPIQSGDGDGNKDVSGEETKHTEPRRVEVTIDVPKRFEKLMKAEESWAMNKLKQEEDFYGQKSR